MGGSSWSKRCYVLSHNYDNLMGGFVQVSYCVICNKISTFIFLKNPLPWRHSSWSNIRKCWALNIIEFFLFFAIFSKTSLQSDRYIQQVIDLCYQKSYPPWRFSLFVRQEKGATMVFPS